MPGLRRLPTAVSDMFDRVDAASSDTIVSDALLRWRQARGTHVYPARGDLPAPSGAEMILERQPPEQRDWRIGQTGDAVKGLLHPVGDMLSRVDARRLAVRLRRLADLASEEGEPLIGSFREIEGGAVAGYEVLCAPIGEDHLHTDGAFVAIDRVARPEALVASRSGHEPEGWPETRTRAAHRPMTVAEVMSRPLVSVTPTTTVTEIADLLVEKRISAVPVLDDEKLVGIVSEADLVQRAGGESLERLPWWLLLLRSDQDLATQFVKMHGRTAAEVMNKKVVVVSPAAPIREAVKRMIQHDIRRLVVVDETGPVGILARRDVLKAIGDEGETTGIPIGDADLRDAVLTYLRQQQWYHLPDRDVIAIDGVVCIWGTVESDAEREALRIAAESVRGVRRVELATVVAEGLPLP